LCLPARAEPIGEGRGDADEPDADRVGRHIEHAARIDMVEPFAIDEQQGQALLWRQSTEEARRHRVDLLALLAEQAREACIFDLRLAHGIDVVAQLAEPMPINLAKGPDIERHAALIAMLLGQHALKRSAKKGRALFPRADQQVGKAFQPRQHGDEAGPYGVVESLCLHLVVPPPLG
jgi:hypothetical protein